MWPKRTSSHPLQPSIESTAAWAVSTPKPKLNIKWCTAAVLGLFSDWKTLKDHFNIILLFGHFKSLKSTFTSGVHCSVHGVFKIFFLYFSDFRIGTSWFYTASVGVTNTRLLLKSIRFYFTLLYVFAETDKFFDAWKVFSFFAETRFL